MLAAVRQRDGRAVAEAMERALRDAGIAGGAMVLPVDPVGATWERASET
jgi:DNA-binding GntR family transcriptional regulator